MARRIKQPSFSGSKRTPRRIGNVTIGTHVLRGSDKSSRQVGSKQPNFSNPKKTARAHRGIVDQVLPHTSSRESTSDYSKRVNRPRYTETMQRNARIKGAAIAAVILAAVLAIAGAVGALAYTGSVTDKMSLTDPMAVSALSAPVENQPYYVLLVGEFYEPGKEYDGPDLIMLVRLDEASKKASIISIPANLQVQLSDGNFKRISEAQLLGGDAALIDEVEKLTDVSVSHFIKTDKESFIQLVDALGGVTVDVAEEVDDPIAGPYYIAAGRQTLDGEQALTLCRATNFTENEQVRAENQCKVAVALGLNLLDANAFGLVFTLDGIAGLFKTDYSANGLMGLITAFRGIAADGIGASRVPGYTTTSTATGIEYFISDDAEWGAMKAALKAGEEPADAVPAPEPVDPAGFSIIVRNGSGVTGGAAQVADLLTAGGFQIAETGNADQYVYGETLVIYHTDDKAAAAETVVQSLGVGRVVPSNGFYIFESDVLVVVGKDWKPLN